MFRWFEIAIIFGIALAVIAYEVVKGIMSEPCDDPECFCQYSDWDES